MALGVEIQPRQPLISGVGAIGPRDPEDTDYVQRRMLAGLLGILRELGKINLSHPIRVGSLK